MQGPGFPTNDWVNPHSRRQHHLCTFIFQCLKGLVPTERLCARASFICFFFKRQQNCHIDSTRFPSGPHRRRRFVVYISRKFFLLFKIWLATRRLIAILSLAAPPRDPKIALYYHFRRRISHSNTCTILILYLTDYKYGIRQMFLTEQ